jgi:hypothetical protein
MGFKFARKTYRLVFEDDDLGGLIVECRPASVAAYRDISQLAAGLPDVPTTDDLAKIDAMLEAFAERLISWNIESDVLDDAGEPTGEVAPLPATLDGLRTLEWPHASRIIIAWMNAIANVDLGLSKPSSDGTTDLLDSVPVELADLPLT